jgi:hypothetical protein
VHVNQIVQWKHQAVESMPATFDKGAEAKGAKT